MFLPAASIGDEETSSPPNHCSSEDALSKPNSFAIEGEKNKEAATFSHSTPDRLKFNTKQVLGVNKMLAKQVPYWPSPIVWLLCHKNLMNNPFSIYIISVG